MIELRNRQLREIYVDLLIKYAKEYPELVIVEADLMKALKSTAFYDVYPERTINVGVQEANMIGGVAAV